MGVVHHGTLAEIRDFSTNCSNAVHTDRRRGTDLCGKYICSYLLGSPKWFQIWP